MRQHHLIPGLLSLISLFWLYRAFTVYGIWESEVGPLGGFMPTLAALATLVFSITAMLKSPGKPKPWHGAVFVPVAIVLAVIIAVHVIGMLPALFFMLVFWFKFLEKYPWPFTLFTAACVIGAVWAVFQAWLNVPFPKGLFA